MLGPFQVLLKLRLTVAQDAAGGAWPVFMGSTLFVFCALHMCTPPTWLVKELWLT